MSCCVGHLRRRTFVASILAVSASQREDLQPALISYAHALPGIHALPEEHASSPLRYITGTPPIVFAVATGAEHLQDRAAGVISTWCSRIHACVFFSDAGNPHGEPAVVPLAVTAGEDADAYKQAQ